MKNFFKLSGLAAFALTAIIALSSFSGPEMEQFVGKIKEVTEQLKNAKTYEDLMAANDRVRSDMKQFEESRLPLTDADYNAVAKAIYDMQAAIGMAAGAPGLPAYSEVEAQMIQQFKQYKTLGELVVALQ